MVAHKGEEFLVGFWFSLFIASIGSCPKKTDSSNVHLKNQPYALEIPMTHKVAKMP